MNPLQTRLAAMRRRLRFVVTVRGACLTAATLLAGLLLSAAVDNIVFRYFAVETWPLIRAALLTGSLAVAGAIAVALLIRPLAGRTDDLSLALRVEEQYPILNDSLASAVQFLEDPTVRIDVGASPSLRQEAVQRALRLAQGCDFDKAINSRGLGLAFGVFVLLLGLTVVMSLTRPAQARIALARFADPFGDHPWAGKTTIDVRFPHFLAIGQPLVFTGEVRGTIPAKAEIEFDDTALPNRQVDIKETGSERGIFVASGIKLPTYRTDIRFRVRAGNGASPRMPDQWHTVALRRPPQLASLNDKPSPQILLRQPRYTGLPELVTVPEGTGNLDVIEGTHVTLRAATDQPIARAWIEFRPVVPGVRETLLLGIVGSRKSMEGVVSLGLSNSVWGYVPGVVDNDGKKFTIRFVPAVTGAYVLTVQDKDGLGKSYDFDLNVRPDPLPTVSLLRPGVSQSVLANAEITVQVAAADDVFALRTVFLEYRRKDKNGQWIDAQPKRLPFYDHANVQLVLPTALSFFTGSRVPLPTQLMTLQPKRLTLTQRWAMRGLAFEGETLVIQACAEDFDDVSVFPRVGRSHEIELKIVPKTALSAVLDDTEIQIQQELLKLQAMQERAVKIVVGAEQQWRATGKLRPEDLVELAQAEQIQKDIQARVGTKKDEGIRGELGQVEEMLKDNKLPKSELSERIRSIREELERVSRDNLPKIEPSLGKARRELESPEQPKAPDLKEAGDLGQARAEQEKVQQSFDDLLKLMDERSTFQQLKGELRAILQEQRDRQKEVETLLNASKDNVEVLRSNDNKAELRRTAELQRRLADRAEKLIEQLQQHGVKLADTDPALAEMVDRAAKIGKEEGVPDEMRDISKLLADNFDRSKPAGVKQKAKDGPNVELASKNQARVVGLLQGMLEALDRTRADEVERIVIHQKQEEKHLSDLADKIGKLRQDIETAKKIADPNRRVGELKKLEDELRALQKEAEQSARGLAKAEAQGAALDLKDAAAKMERVLRQLERGEEPEDALQQAQDKVETAREKLKDAREDAEQELSREQIAKIVDRLKGLKERQDGALAESERLRKDFLLNSKWTAPKIRSLMDLKSTQQGVAGETAFFKEKLKEAKVFHTMLDRSHQDMVTAAKKMEDWWITANRHKEARPLDAKELADDKHAYEATVKLQKSAGDRLQRLIDALLPELELPKQEQKAEAEPNPKAGPEGAAEKQGGGIQAQDGIPPVAQLKALKAEQLEVNSRTKEFAELHPSVDKLTAEQRTELDGIRSEQDRLLQLFRELITSGKAEGGKR